MIVTSRASKREVQIPAGHLLLPGELTIPNKPVGLIAFAHGSGSSRLSPRNQDVARYFQQIALGTLLFDLLTEEESRTRANVFDLPLLAERLLAATRWLALEPAAGELGLGYFGASTGAGAALIAAARAGDRIHAVVSRGGRPDLAREWLPEVHAPTLLIVGGLDTAVLGLNQMALDQLHCPKRLVVVPGATHLFEEPGTMEQVSRLAGDWFAHHLRQPREAVKPGL
jgi:pimeloyl-ACP methyl ester carboxylesterase